VSATDQQATEITVAGFGDWQLRRAFTRVILARDQSEVGSDVAAAREAILVKKRENEGQRGQRPNARHLPQNLRLRVAFAGKRLDVLVIATNLFGQGVDRCCQRRKDWFELLGGLFAHALRKAGSLPTAIVIATGMICGTFLLGFFVSVLWMNRRQ